MNREKAGAAMRGLARSPLPPHCFRAMLSSSPTALVASLMPDVREAARQAGAMAMERFREGAQTAAQVWYKPGNSPVTEADIAVDTFLKERLTGLLPEAGWLSEETADDPSRLSRSLVWVVDPIDGTRAFAAGRSEWCVSIALVRDGKPILGTIHAPVPDRLYEASLAGGALLNGRTLRVPDGQDRSRLLISGPKPLMDRYAGRGAEVECLPKIPSLALRIVRVADGTLDLGFASANSHDWDIAAAHLILREAGGALTDLTGTEPGYNRSHPTHGDLVAAAAWLHPRAIRAMRG
ncbi:3'(2'),5'-bisphosphate nucleotidase CysQ [Microvirga pudoricolor]|uniref:3'(2'),5'-bisphosphate nucleotidase CysQ n=1 Tax=Microvirga pudoricolor TaxID=2778729 RepID=UPI00194FADE6|nr:3'(2'),5'-bisphosphate nucleotidase CysQ [Microvirga pudoricolor]MBM6592702.1 3'(2'),5'-bisphosphate nucleotidase CysQ [Microvirga pudoricolor]